MKANRLLHIGCLINPGKGIINQMMWEQKAADSCNIQLDTILFTTDKYSQYSVCKTFKYFNSEVLTYLHIRFRFFLWVFKNRFNYDKILLRYSPYDPFQFFICLFLKNYLTVHHTFEYEEIVLSKKYVKIKYFFESIFSKIVFKNAIGIIGVTNEICIYELKRIKSPLKYYMYPNGILNDFVSSKINSNYIECVFVSSLFQSWTGIDKLIDDYKKNGDLGMKIHLIGLIPLDILTDLKNSTLFVLHGELNTQKIREIYNRCTLGISSFGFEKKNMKEACPLKSREYLSAGLSVIGGYTDAILPIEFPYYTKINPSLKEIKDIAEKLRFVNRNDVREAALPYISKIHLLKQMINFLIKD